MRNLMALLLLFTAVGSAQNYRPENKPDNNWSIIKMPTGIVSQSFGGYANGCMTGAKSLPESGKGFVDMRRNRNRYYGQPELISFIKELGQYTQNKHARKLLIGDLSQPRGGRMNFGHSSHQIGLDADIWMQTVPNTNSVSPSRDMRTTIDKVGGFVLGGTLPQPTRDALYFSATHPNVARIFVNPVVKSNLCASETDTSWLRKLRPWWGHHEHFHVRLHCNPNSPMCRNQNPPPFGDGCNESLFNWVQEQSDREMGRAVPKAKGPKRKKRKKTIPETCQSILW